MSKSKKPVACYVRVSTSGQNQAGQKAEIERWLDGNGIDPESVVWFTDKATGNNLDRRGFQKLQRAVFNGEVGTIVVYRLDRISRSLKDGIGTLGEWCDSGIRVVSVTEQLDFGNSTGKLVASILMSLAEWESSVRRERQAAGIREAKKRGVYRGRKPGTSKANPARARELKERGLTSDEIASSLGVDKRTVFRYLKASS